MSEYHPEIDIQMDSSVDAAVQNILKAKERGDEIHVVLASVDTVDGPSALPVIKEAAGTAPVIATSQLPAWGTIMAAFRLGADDYEVESSNTADLERIVDRYFCAPLSCGLRRRAGDGTVEVSK